MNNIVAVRNCEEYNLQNLIKCISDIYKVSKGPEVKNRKVLLKPNILLDDDPLKCISTHPAVVEAMVRYLQSEGATVLIGDSPAVHMRGFSCKKSGIAKVCDDTGAEWVDFAKNPSDLKLKTGRIRIASVYKEVDLIISLPKFKNHELVYFTGAIKNTLGLVPGFSKAKQHALYQERNSFSGFLVDLNEKITPHFFLMDGIMGMEGSGPAQGNPVKVGVLIGSTNPLALDIIATTIAGYDPSEIPTNRVALERKHWLQSAGDISYDGPDLALLVKKNFRRIAVTGNTNIAIKFLKNRISFLRKLERRPVFIHDNCTGCRECIMICPHNAITIHPVKKNHVVLSDNKCIRCFCCSEVCQFKAVEVRVKLFGV